MNPDCNNKQQRKNDPTWKKQTNEQNKLILMQQNKII